MRVVDTSVSPVESDATMWAGVRQAPAIRHLDVVLKPVSRPELGEIRIDAAVFPIGRTEQPFDSYGNDVLNMLSRRHASLFRKEGFVYLVDLQSRNGTTVNRIGIGLEPCQLRDGDEICFGGSLSYRIQITPRVRPEGSLALMLTPESADSGLETIVIAKFPFLASKTDGIFSNYKSDGAHGAELRFLSRRHAHIYQKGEQAYIGDLGSANGTFVDGQRLQEQAVPLVEGAVVAFGGKHFVYRVSVVRESGAETLFRDPPARSSPTLAQDASPMPRSPLLAQGLLLAQDSPLVPRRPPMAHEVPPTKRTLLADGKPAVPTRANINAEGKPAAPASANTNAEGEPAAPASANINAGGKPAAPASANTKANPQAAANSFLRGKAQTAVNPSAASQPPSAATPQRESNPQAAAARPQAERNPQPTPNAQRESQPQSPVRAPAASQPHSSIRPAAASSQQAAPRAHAENNPQPPSPGPAAAAQNAPRSEPNLLAMDSGTQFMAAPTSFLTVLCAADQPKKADAAAAPVDAAAEAPSRRRPRGRVMLLLSELVTLIKGEPDGTPQRRWKIAAVAGGVLVALILTAYVWNAKERALNQAIARNDYPRAATLAAQLLDKHPDDIELRARATEVGLKATVPAWLLKLQARDFDGAKSVLTGTAELSKSDADLRPLFDELEWLGNLERLISVRGGPDAPIRIYADEDSIEHVIGRWNEDTGDHQRALARIASHVPQFGDWYGEALTHLRRLQSESTVYLPVVARIKTNIATELARDNPDVLKPALKETAEQYPRLGGMDSVRQDLARYIEIRREARSRKSGRLFALLAKAHFATPPFQQSFHALMEGGQLPPADLLRQYNAATQEWTELGTMEALQKLTTGPWGDELAHELERRRVISTGFAALQQSQNAGDHVNQLLAFRESLDTNEDAYFVRATADDLNQQKGEVIARAEGAMNQARTLWQEYRSRGAIDASQRIETSISDDFRARAHALAGASQYARQAFQLDSQVDAAGAAPWTAIREEIETEVHEQRRRLRDLSNVVEPALLNSKLALLGDASE